MKNIIFTILVSIPLFSHISYAQEWQSLLDPGLSKWELYMGVPHKSVKIPGAPASTSKNGITGAPLGLNNDPLKVFQMIEEDGKPVLKITGQIYGGLTSKAEYENYHFRCQFKWGTKKWAPRLNTVRDSGILFHAYGKHGRFWNVWMSSLECQIQEGDCGDFIPLAGPDVKLTMKKRGKGRPVFDFNGEYVYGAGYVSHAPSVEKPNGEWNTIEIYTVGQTSTFLVNGTPNMVLFEATKKEGNKRVPLTKGKIQIQSEAAEIYYKNIEIKNIEKFPKHILKYINKPVTQAVKFSK